MRRLFKERITAGRLRATAVADDSLIHQGKGYPAALLCATDLIAIGALSAVMAAGLVAGRDISIIGHDGVSAGLLTTPHLSTTEIAAPDVGTRLADKLIRRLGGTDPRDLTELLAIKQIPRASHGYATRTLQKHRLTFRAERTIYVLLMA